MYKNTLKWFGTSEFYCNKRKILLRGLTISGTYCIHCIRALELCRPVTVLTMMTESTSKRWKYHYLAMMYIAE